MDILISILKNLSTSSNSNGEIAKFVTLAHAKQLDKDSWQLVWNYESYYRLIFIFDGCV